MPRHSITRLSKDLSCSGCEVRNGGAAMYLLCDLHELFSGMYCVAIELLSR